MVGGTPGLPLRGRDGELAAIGARLDQVRSGVGSVIIVEGRAGLGKTRLLDACTSMAAERSFRVGRGAMELSRRVVELDALFDALFDGDNPLVARDALSDLHASPEQRFWLLQDIQALIEEAALRDPLLICLDDLHWGGAGCAVAMRQLPQRLASLPVGWVMAFRPNQGLPEVQSAKDQLEDAGAETIRLGPLGRKAVAEIARDVLGAEPDEELLHKAELVQGNPFLLIEFFRGLQDEHIVMVDSGRAKLPAAAQRGRPDGEGHGRGLERPADLVHGLRAGQCHPARLRAVHGQANERRRRVRERRIARRVHRPPRHRRQPDPQGHREDLGTNPGAIGHSLPPQCGHR
jgi:predicted ATPase